MSNSELIPCAHCGYVFGRMPEDELHPSSLYWVQDGGRHRFVGPTHVGGQPMWEVNCPEVAGGCGLGIRGFTRDEVITKWNRREDRTGLGTLARSTYPSAERRVNYGRVGDMTPPGDSVLIAHIQEDGDVCLRIDNRSAGNYRAAEIEFCASGGKSLHTLHALHQLAAGMAADNREVPAGAWPPVGHEKP